MRYRVMPAFGRYRLYTITHARVSAWFDAMSADTPGSANRAFEILRAMLRTARQWGELPESVPDACANIVMNPRRPVARYLDDAELERLGAVLDRHRDTHPWHVAALRLLTLTGARLSEMLNLRWDEIADLSTRNGGAARLPDTKTGAAQGLARTRRGTAGRVTPQARRRRARVPGRTHVLAGSMRSGPGSASRPGSTACASTTCGTASPPKA